MTKSNQMFKLKEEQMMGMIRDEIDKLEKENDTHRKLIAKNQDRINQQKDILQLWELKKVD